MGLSGVVTFLVVFGGMIGPEPGRWITSVVVRTAVPVAVTRYIATTQELREVMKGVEEPPLPSKSRRPAPKKPQDPLTVRR